MFVIEMCLIDSLEDIFTPSYVARINDPELPKMGGEKQSVQERRTQLTEKRTKLQQALDQCVAKSASSMGGQ